jgi:hypothetical protein
MSQNLPDQETATTSPSAAGEPMVLRLTADERQVVQLALGELLQSTRRGEHLVPVIQSLLARIQSGETPAS